MRSLIGKTSRAARVASILAVVVTLSLLPRTGSAGPHTVFGSLAIANANPAPNGSPLNPGDIVGLILIANPGMEKTISVSLPPYAAPVFIDVDQDGDKHVLNSRFDTIVALTNATGSTLQVLLTLRDAAGIPLGSEMVTIGPHATEVVKLSSLL